MQRPAALPLIRVFATPGVSWPGAPLRGTSLRGRIVAGNVSIAGALGKGGITHGKREGDGATPAGAHRPVHGYYRADRIRKPATAVPLAPLRADDGWCDATGHSRYNRHVTLPFPARHETMWRDDHLYDIVIDLGWNARPRAQRRGSAIFLHLAREDGGPTEGCIAVPRDKARRLLALLGPRTRSVVAGKPKPVRKRKSVRKPVPVKPRRR